ncbi:MAG: insulinase family protein [Clostridiales bacterium]|jgi:predicted Zn-dependent peptidase|nr:insulinase family protein [Clostridiales bacterium]
MHAIKSLNNDIKIITEENRFIRSISLGIWVNIGSKNENKKTNGLSHFIEHMVFKGTNDLNSKNIADRIDLLGGQANAFTTKDLTCFYIRILDTDFDSALELLSHIVLKSNFPDEEIEREKHVIIEEINMYEDSPEELVFEMINKNVLIDTSLGLPILGDANKIKNYKQKNLKDYYNKNYIASNFIITASGNFKSIEIVDKINNFFGDLKKIDSDNLNNFENVNYRKSFDFKIKDIEQSHMCIAFPGIKHDIENNYAMAVFNTIFGGGMSSRLYQKIREEFGLAYSIYSYNYSYDTIGVFVIYAATSQNKFKKCLELILREIKDLYIKNITEEDILKTKQQLKSSYLMALESSSSRMSSLGKSYCTYKKVLTPDEIIDKINSVKLGDVYKLANEIFNFNQISLCVVAKNKLIEENEFEEIINNSRK